MNVTTRWVAKTEMLESPSDPSCRTTAPKPGLANLHTGASTPPSFPHPLHNYLWNRLHMPTGLTENWMDRPSSPFIGFYGERHPMEWRRWDRQAVLGSTSECGRRRPLWWWHLGNDGKELRERSMWTVGKRILQTEGAEKALESRFWMSSGRQSWGQTTQGLRANGQVLWP